MRAPGIAAGIRAARFLPVGREEGPPAICRHVDARGVPEGDPGWVEIIRDGAPVMSETPDVRRAAGRIRLHGKDFFVPRAPRRRVRPVSVVRVNKWNESVRLCVVP
jgi:hypothetical protein